MHKFPGFPEREFPVALVDKCQRSWNYWAPTPLQKYWETSSPGGLTHMLCRFIYTIC